MTDFEICGHCTQYSIGYDVYPSEYGECAIIDNKPIKNDERCILKRMGKHDIDFWIHRHLFSRQRAVAYLRREDETLAILSDFMEDAADAPPLPRNRNEHFAIGDVVMIYDAQRNEWFRGTLVDCEGYVACDLDSGRDMWCGILVPHLLLLREYEFFKEHPDAYATWCTLAYNETYNGKRLDVAPIV